MLKENFSILGTTYGLQKQKIIKTNSDFPCAFACAFDLEKTGYNLCFLPEKEKSTIEKTGRDVGYKIRETFDKKKYKYGSFTINNDVLNFDKITFSNKSNPDSYYYKEELISIHFVKSSRSFNALKTRKQNTSLLEKITFQLNSIRWERMKNKQSKFILNYAS
jgi:hypothetical protein